MLHASRLPRLHAQPDVVKIRAHADERALLPAVGRVRANGTREAVHYAVRRTAVEDECVARLDAHRLVPHVEVNGEADRARAGLAALAAARGGVLL